MRAGAIVYHVLQTRVIKPCCVLELVGRGINVTFDVTQTIMLDFVLEALAGTWSIVSARAVPRRVFIEILQHVLLLIQYEIII